MPLIRDCLTKLDFEHKYDIRHSDLGMVSNINKEIMEFSTLCVPTPLTTSNQCLLIDMSEHTYLLINWGLPSAKQYLLKYAVHCDYFLFVLCKNKTSWYLSRHLISNNSWTWHFKYIKHLFKANSVINYFYLRSWKTRFLFCKGKLCR